MKDFLVRLTWVDYIAAIAVLRGFYVGYRGGIFPELLRIASYLISVLLAFYFYELLGQLVTMKSFLNEATATAVSFVALLIAGFLLTWLVRTILLKLLKVGEGGFALRMVGLFLGGLRWVILLSFVFMLIDHSPLEQLKKDIHARSFIGGPVSQVGPLLFDFMAQLSPQLGLPVSQQPQG